ncbi:bifunctional 4-hydroxy-2-oxoglutarate aldolase/2-dehydro-3-deoxy-phosphogluconate aldolase [bacterium]|jgi:2-dehydro-3-deoxyphosphogluconate aldolase/(4S)-4-hydroxy-2-oxoglutarate aldolase|nr:bifunctional 4-hydroxy-2-oxoglutarate aldolase/2-dehydro-3-deoxy-phosphogluconate aldolase [bacterium]
MDIREFKQLPIMGILRGIEKSSIEPLTEQIILSGLKTIEVAMNTKDAPEIIRNIKTLSKGRLTVGAGTVLTLDDLRSALDAGATFIVLPVLIKDVVEYCVKNNIPVFPGALTPQEIYNAWSMGASMVKVFPAKFFGPAYFREIKAPFNDVGLLACGGVDKNNIKEFFSCGASAVAFGASIFKKELIRGGRFKEIREDIESLINACE